MVPAPMTVIAFILAWQDWDNYITLDSITVAATKKGFSVDDFIDLVQNDTTFAYAFMHLRICDHDSKSEVQYFDKKGKEKDHGWIDTHQSYQDDCREMEFTRKETSKRFYKRNESYRYYTSLLFHHSFYTDKKICGYEPKIRSVENINQLDGITKRIVQLKTLIFNPGADVGGIPLIRNRLQLFEPEMRTFYDFSIESRTYENGEECYVFTANPKSGLSKKDTDYLVIRSLETWFSKSTFEIVKRNYRLANETPLFDFDVAIDVDLDTVDGYLVPVNIHYDGFWDLAIGKPEWADYKVEFSGFDFDK